MRTKHFCGATLYRIQTESFMKNIFLLLLFSMILNGAYAQDSGTLEVVAEMNIRPGNVAVSPEGRVFTTIHPLGAPTIQLVEITGKKTMEPFPSAEYQNDTGTPSDSQFDTPLGVRVDENDVLWVIDMGLNLGKTRLFAFNINTREEVFRYDFPEEMAPAGSFIQDLAVDIQNGWIYLADIADPGILALNIKTNGVRRFADESVQAEPVDMIIDGELIYFGGAPASVAINPITLSADKNTLYYGAMSGTTWYKLPATLFRDGASNYEISQAIKVVGPKPLSDGVATDVEGNHYFTNIQHGGIDVLSPTGELKPLYRDDRISWPDNVSIDGQGWIYMTVNQLHKAPAFTGGADEGEPPYFIYRIRL